VTRNAEVAALFEEFADRLEAMDVEYKPQAYRRAAENIRANATDIEALAEEGQDAVEEIQGVGDAISSKVLEYFETGKIAELEELREELPVDIEALTAVEGVGPKTVGDLYEALGVRDLDDLEAAAEAGEIQAVKGYGTKTEQNILNAIPFARESRERALLGDARPVADRLLAFLSENEAVERVDTAGSLRRWRPTVGDVDVLVASEDGEAVVETFTDWTEADEVIEAGKQKASVRSNGLRVDCRVVVPEEYGSALQYFTGSRDHNVSVRNRAIEMGLKMNEYGVFDIRDAEDPDAGQRIGERVAGETEAEMYEAVDLPWIPSEMREDRGEVEAAAAGALPDLVHEGDLRGDLHTHTDFSDGRETLAGMLEAAGALGHEYYAVTDHATGPGMVGGVGLDDDDLLAQIEGVREAAESVEMEVFTGVEANVGTDGDLNVGDGTLEALDVVIASPHAGLDGDGTDRLVMAMEHPEVDVLGHPTGRMLNQRPGLEVDYGRIAAVAADNDVALEINSNPSRLDLRGAAVKTAVEAGATVVVNTDGHSPRDLEYLRYGVHTARRGWAETADVLNAWPVEEVRTFLGVD
jgi:DNA polymerase (family 10)